MKTAMSRLILLVAIVAVGLVSCENAAIKEIRRGTEEANRSCPSEISPGLYMSQISFLEDEMVVEYVAEFTQDPMGTVEDIENNRTLVALNLNSSTGSLREFYEMLSGNGVGITYRYKSDTWTRDAVLRFTPEDITGILNNPLSDEEIAEAQFAQVYNNYKSLVGRQIDEMTIISQVELEGDTLTIYYKLIDSPEFRDDYNSIIYASKYNHDEFGRELFKEVIGSQQATQERKIFVDAGKYMELVYLIPDGNGVYKCSVICSPDEMRFM